MSSIIGKINTVKIPLENILLDPNNLRFSKNINIKVESIADPIIQEETYKIMNNEDEGYQIYQLEKSILKNSFVNIDDLWVKKIPNSKYYYVIEGNRRITAIKNLINKENNTDDFNLEKDIKDSFLNIFCKDLSELDDDKLNILLGFKHMGGQLDWKAFPIAQALYREYTKTLYIEGLTSSDYIAKSDKNQYIRNTKVTKNLAEQFSLKTSHVNRYCASYRIYLQLKEQCAAYCGKEFDTKLYFGRIYEGLMTLSEVKKRYNFSLSDATISEDGIKEFLDLNIGDHELDPVITSTTTGESSYRDFNWVLKNDDSEEYYTRQIVEDRMHTSKAKSLLQATLKEQHIREKLKIAKKQLESIEAGEMNNNLADAERDLLNEIMTISKKILDFDE